MAEMSSFDVRRRTILAGGLASLAAVLAACSESSSAGSSKTGGEIGLLLQSYRNPRFKNVDEPAFRRAVEAAGYTCVSLQAEDDPSKQSTQMDQLIARGCLAIALQPVTGPPTAQMVKKADDAGIPVVAYNSSIPSELVKGFVARNNRKVGQALAEAAKEDGRLEGKWVIVAGPESLAVATDFVQGIKDVIDPLISSGTIEVVDEKFHANFSTETAHQQAVNMLTRHGNDIDGFFCNSDQLAQGVVTALVPGAPVPWIGSQDASASGCRAILTGQMAVSLFTKFDEMGVKAAELCVKLAKKEQLTGYQSEDFGYGAIPFVEIPFIGVRRDTIVDYLEQYSPSYVDAAAVVEGVPESQWPSGLKELVTR
jgi:D-xylose transport system substrate-binding protein